MPNLPDSVISFIERENLLMPGDRVVVGVSGGPDSVALLHLLAGLRERWDLHLRAAYMDHGLRPGETPGEIALVREQAGALAIPVQVGRVDSGASARKEKVSVQMAARRLRLAFLAQVRREVGGAKLALGHTADDQVELFFLRLLRGAGPEGLAGMRAATPGGIIRPLLVVRKADILAWLAREGIPYCQDSSNQSRAYQRNRVRLDLLPELRRTYNPRLAETVPRAMGLLREQEDYLAEETARLVAKLFPGLTASGWRLALAELLQLHPYVQKRVLRQGLYRTSADLAGLRQDQVDAALRLARGEQGSGAVSLPGGWRLVRRHGWLELRPRQEGEPEPDDSLVEFPATAAGRVSAGGWTFTWKTRPASPADRQALDSPATSARLDREAVALPLAVRRPRPGDRFRPLGMRGSKKLQDFFVDAKVPREARGSVPLLVSQEEIIWVVGHRLAEGVKVTPATTRVLELTAVPARE